MLKRHSLDQMPTHNQFPPAHLSRFFLMWDLRLYARVPTMQLPIHFTTGLGRFQSYFISKGQSSPAPQKGQPDPPACVTPTQEGGLAALNLAQGNAARSPRDLEHGK